MEADILAIWKREVRLSEKAKHKWRDIAKHMSLILAEDEWWMRAGRPIVKPWKHTVQVEFRDPNQSSIVRESSVSGSGATSSNMTVWISTDSNYVKKGITEWIPN
jgi:hypothetical protein